MNVYAPPLCLPDFSQMVRSSLNFAHEVTWCWLAKIIKYFRKQRVYAIRLVNTTQIIIQKFLSITVIHST